MATPVVIAENGRGTPVTNAEGAAPFTPVSNGFGIPIVLVDAGGYPMSLVNEDGTPWTDASILLSNQSVPENAALNDLVGVLSVVDGTGSYTFTITADPDAKFLIDGDELQVADFLDYETATSHSVTIEADNGVDDPISRQFTITVTNVAPTVVFFFPDDNTINVDPDVTLVATFTEDVFIGTSGQITLKRTSDDAIIQSWDAPTQQGSAPGQCEITNGDELTLHLTTSLGSSVEYYVIWDAGVVEDGAGAPVAALVSTTAWSFTTAAEVVAPTISTLLPADNAIDVVTAGSLVATFSEPVAFGTGTINLFDADTDLIESFDVVADVGTGAGQVSISGTELTINPTAELEENKGHYVQIDATAIEDIAGNAFAGIADTTTWNFTTGFSAEAKAVFALMVPPPNAALQEDVAVYIKSLKDGGAWPVLDQIGLLITDEEQYASINIKTPGVNDFQFINDPVFTVNAGIATDGAESYIILLNPVTAGIQATRNDFSYGIRLLNNRQSASSGNGFNDGTDGISLVHRNTSNLGSIRINQASADNGTTSVTDSRFLMHASRGSGTTCEVYGDGVAHAGYGGFSSSPVNDHDIYLGRNTEASYIADTYGSVYIGKAITAPIAAVIAAADIAYKTARETP